MEVTREQFGSRNLDDWSSRLTPGSFTDNMSLPIHRWFRYSAGFSGEWAKHVIIRNAGEEEICVFDPFAGCGTALIAAEQCGVKSWGMEAHPFVAKVARAKLAYRSPPDDYLRLAEQVLSIARESMPSLWNYGALIRKCYSVEALEQLDCLKNSVLEVNDGSESWELVWMTLVSILRPTAQVGTANWQYLLPKRRKVNPKQPFQAFEDTTNLIHGDMRANGMLSGPRANFVEGDSRICGGIPDNSVTLVVTSPPYANNYDYADATRLELTFFGEIAKWGDLQSTIRRHLIRSCTQHVPDKSVDLLSVIAKPELEPIREELEAACDQLSEIRLGRGGKKTYNNMIACYFSDLAQVWRELRRVCRPHAKLCFVVGDSAPYGVHVPTPEWLGKLAVAAGFMSYSFEKTRDRNIKWENRKHRVPLCEGELWVEG